MSDIEEKRMYADRREETVAYVASAEGVATVRLSGDRIGRFGLERRCHARDVATHDGRVYAATETGVLAGEGFESLSFDRPAVAVAAGDAGDAGVFRVHGDEVVDVGLSDVRDVAAAGVPLAATGDGLYRLGNGWLCERDGPLGMVAAAGDGDRAHAATGETLFVHGEDGWTAVDLPVTDLVADVAYGECVYAVTAAGTVLVAADPDRTADGAGGWRSRSLGLSDVAAVAVVQ
ncbi:hypothetical protein BRC64_10750 [Halobacteriales archaeon QH_10_67_22]|nr:MAG: hypothetical protein BRC64_10750 [Halobacteriales archaeon QH_10_67_22]